MFPLAGSAFPESAGELAAGVREALGEVFTFAKREPVTVEGGAWPVVKYVKVDLSGATIKASDPPPPPKPKGTRRPGITVDQLDFVGQPIRYEKSELDLLLKARAVSFDFAHDSKGVAMLVLTDARDGRVDVKVGKDELRSLLLSAASAAVKPHGVAIQDIQLNLMSDGPRSIGGDVRVKAKKLLMSGVVTIHGKAELDDQLVATLSGLSCSGEGMVGGMAAAFLQGYLKKADGKRFPLMAFSLGDVSLRDVKISLKKDYEVTVEFGGAGK